MSLQQQKTEETKQRLVAAAFGLLKKGTFAALTAGKITKAAGISKGGFFHHFPQIEDFYLYMLDAILHSLEEAILPNHANSLTEYLQSSMENSFTMIEESPEIFTVIFNFLDLARFKPNYAAKVREILEIEVNNWAKTLETFYPEELSTEKKEAITYLIDMYFAGLSTHYLILENKKRYRFITNEFISMLIHYIQGVES